MAEYIEREAALNATFKIPVKILAGRIKTARKAVQAYADYIAGLPAADVQPVVRCRDCKNNYHGINEPMCDFTDRKLREDDFCSHGEKREVNDDER